MKKKILFLLTLFVISACLRLASKPIADDYSPVSGVLPSDASENVEYNINVKDLKNNEITMVITNELYNYKRDNTIVFEKQFSSNLINKSLGNSKKPIDNKIISMPFKYDYNRVLKTKVTKDLDVKKSISKSVVGDIKTFNALRMGSSQRDITVRGKLIKSLTNNDRTVNFWVDETKYSGTATVSQKINDSMIAILVEKFIGQKRGIYEELTGIFGKEWFDGVSSKDYLLNGNKTIDILLFDMNESYEGGRVIGYFNPDDLFLKHYAFSSNESVMFYLDAYSFADSSPWNSEDYWPDNTISTLAHEFMHLITYYQKTIVRGSPISTWLNEMISMLAEDIVSYNINTYGPRGVLGTVLTSGYSGNTMGRLAYANYYNHYPSNSYDMDSYIEYAVTYSYGAYLLRSYGTGENGLEFLKDLVLSKYQDINAIEYAIKNRGYSRSFIDTLQEWSKAIVLSNEKFYGNEKYKYQNGSGFISYLNGKTYQFGDINLYNYSDTPTYYTTGGDWLPKLDRGSNLLFYLGKGSGSFNMKIFLPKYSRVQFIIKNELGDFDSDKSSSVTITKVN